jgi:hypothetical protein
MLVVLGIVAAWSGLANGAEATRCVAEPFSFSSLQTTQFERADDRARIAWQASGTTELACPNGVLTIDVWEHAVVVARGQDGGVRLAGDVATRVSVPDGGTVVMGGLMQGSGPCADGICVVETKLRARGPEGESLRLKQTVTLDFSTGLVTDVDVLRIVIEFTSAG